jgi:hypothetical protein
MQKFRRRHPLQRLVKQFHFYLGDSPGVINPNDKAAVLGGFPLLLFREPLREMDQNEIHI